MVPEDYQAIALPCTSEIRILVLLNEEFTCATPAAMFLRSLRRGAARQVSRAIVPALLLLLDGDRLRRALAGAGIGVGALAAHGQVAAMAQAAIAAEIHQPLDVHLHLAAQVTFDRQVGVDMFADRQNFGVGEFVDPAALVDAHGVADLAGGRLSDSVNIGQSDGHPFVGRDVHTGDTCHVASSFRCGSVIPEPFFTTCAPDRAAMSELKRSPPAQAAATYAILLRRDAA